MDPISIGLGVISGLSSLGGLLGGEAAKRRAEQARQRALLDYATSIDQAYQNQMQANQHSLYAAAGLGGDAIHAMGARFGDSLAASGVYNSSAVAGALANAQHSQDQSLAGLAFQNTNAAKQAYSEGQRTLSQLRLGQANQQYGEASSQLAGSQQGLSSFLGSLAQYGLARSGANQVQASLSRPAGGYGNMMPLAPGAGMLQSPLTLGPHPSPFSLPTYTAPWNR